MTSKMMMLTGAAVVALAGGAGFAPCTMAEPIPPALSYADLLVPVPDAMARLDADDAQAAGDAHLIPAQIQIGIGGPHHHHHHYHHHSARWYRSHGFYWNGQVWIQGPPPRPRRYRDHHHHHHHQNWR